MARWAQVFALLSLLAACSPPPCKPQSCADVGRSCGAVVTCGETLDCGACSAGASCSGAGRCVPDQCTGKSCAELHAACGVIDDTCGTFVYCGECSGNDRCSGNACCTPKTCQQLGVECGSVADGCGGSAVCDACPTGKLCGAGGSPNVCATAPDACAAGGWNAYAQSFFKRNCLACHGPYGQWENVSGNAEMIRDQISSGNMPRGRALGADEKDWILKWLDCGAKK